MTQNTFLGWLTQVPGIILSEESMTKVSIITDINKMVVVVTGNVLSTTEFDYMYDMSLKQLEEYEKSHKLSLEAEIRWREYEQVIASKRGNDGE